MEDKAKAVEQPETEDKKKKRERTKPRTSKVNALTDLVCKSLKYSDTPPMKFDGGGLFIEAMKTRKVWRFKSTLKNGKTIMMTLGTYRSMTPAKTSAQESSLTLADARARREELRDLIAQGKDPREVVRSQEQAELERKTNTLEAVAQEWLHLRSDKAVKSTIRTYERILNADVFPVLGNSPVSGITTADVLGLIKNIELRAVTVARLARSVLARVFAYAVRTGKCANNPAAAIIPSEDLKQHKTQNFKTISLKDLPHFLKAVVDDKGGIQVKTAIRLMLMLFMRKMELCRAEWSHIDLGAGTWTIPAENTKKRREMVHPLPRQAVALLLSLKSVTGKNRYVFGTGSRHNDAPLGEQTLNTLITRIGYHRKMTVHGFRALAASWLDEQGFNRLAIERQLSHLERGQTNQAYHRSDYMDERRKMLQAWADYLESLKDDTNQGEEIQQEALKAA